MGHTICERFFLHGLPGTGDGKDKAPAACRIGWVSVCDHGHGGLGTLGGIIASDDHCGPTRGHTLPHHRAQQGIVTAITGLALGQNEPKAPGEARAVPYCPQQDEAQAKKPGMMLTVPPLRRSGIFGAACVGVTSVSKELQHAIGGAKSSRDPEPTI